MFYTLHHTATYFEVPELHRSIDNSWANGEEPQGLQKNETSVENRVPSGKGNQGWLEQMLAMPMRVFALRWSPVVTFARLDVPLYGWNIVKSKAANKGNPIKMALVYQIVIFQHDGELTQKVCWIDKLEKPELVSCWQWSWATLIGGTCSKRIDLLKRVALTPSSSQFYCSETLSSTADQAGF